MAEKYLSTTGLTKLVEEMSSLTSSALNGMYGSIMGQCLKRSELNNGLEFGTNPNTEGYDGDPYLKLSADGISGMHNEIYVDTLGESIFLGSGSVSTGYFSYNIGDVELFGASSVNIHSDYQGGMDGVGESSIAVGNGIDISSGANLNISAKDYSDADSGFDYGNINIESKNTTIQVDSTFSICSGVDGANLSIGETIDMSGDVNVNKGVFSADNGKYLHMPNNESMLDLDVYKEEHISWAGEDLRNTSDYTSTIIFTTSRVGSYTIFKDAETQSGAVYNFTLTEDEETSSEEPIHYHMGSTTSDPQPRWIINPISNNVIDLYKRTLSIAGPSINLIYTSGDAGTNNGSLIGGVTTRLSSLTCTYKAKVYRSNTLIGTKELGTTESINPGVLQTMQTGQWRTLQFLDLSIDFSEQEWLEWIQTKDATFTLKDWKDNISIIIVGDLNFARPRYTMQQYNIQGFEFSLGSASTITDYPRTDYKFAKPFYEGSKDGIRQYFNDANYFSMIPDQSTELYTPKFSISGNTYAAAFYETSDEKLKDFSNEITVDFDKLKEIRKSYFTWKDGDGKIQIGTSAQDVQKVYPELVSENKDGNLTVDYAKLSLVALAAVDKLEERLAKIEKMLNITE